LTSVHAPEKGVDHAEHHVETGGGGARICTKWDTYPDGREFVGIGCIPNVEVNPTRADIAAGRDVVLEKARAVLREQIGR